MVERTGPDDPSHADDAVDAFDAEVVDAEVVDAEPGPPGAAPIVVDVLPAPPVDTGYTATGVPTFESVREKIETRYGTAIGSSELASETTEGRRVEEQYEARQRAAQERLDEIRASMRDEPGHA